MLAEPCSWSTEVSSCVVVTEAQEVDKFLHGWQNFCWHYVCSYTNCPETPQIVLVTFFAAVTKYRFKQLKEERVYLGSQFNGKVNHGREVTLRGVWNSWSHLDPQSGVKSDKCQFSASSTLFILSRTLAHGTVQPTVRMALLTPINVI